MDLRSIKENKLQFSLSNGDDVVLSDRFTALLEVEEYFLSKIKDYDIEYSFDCTAAENLYFNTINYTTFAGFFIMHPLTIEQSMRQMQDAFSDQCSPAGFVNYVREVERLDGKYTKYEFNSSETCEAKTALVVLPGGNKLAKHMCAGKIQKILDRHGKDNVLFKKHPISHDKEYQDLDKYLGGIHYASGYSDLNALMDKSEYVYSSMLSDSALIACIKGKKLDHFDLFQNRHLGSFTHINYYIYSTPAPLKWVDVAFSSPKSGVIHPDVDADWKNKLDHYLEYIMGLRALYKDKYLMR